MKKKLKIEFFREHPRLYVGRVTIPACGRTLIGKNGPKYIEFPEMYFMVYFYKPTVRHFGARAKGFIFSELTIKRKSDGNALEMSNTTDGIVCLGDALNNVSYKNPIKLCEDAVVSFWQSRFSSTLYKKVVFDKNPYQDRDKLDKKVTLKTLRSLVTKKKKVKKHKN